MKNAFKVVKKELDKIFKFPRMIFTSLVLPGLMLFLIYAFIGAGFNSFVGETVEHISQIYVVNFPESLKFAYNLADEMKITIYEMPEEKLEELKERVQNNEIDAIIFYEKDFDAKVNTENLPVVEIYYNNSSSYSSSASNKAHSIISLQQQNFFEELGINPHIFEMKLENVEEEAKANASIIAMILPMLIMSFIFASALGIGTDAIAGEKERGTLATLLMLPVKRSEIIFGKIISTSTLTVLSAFSSFIGIIASLPFSKSIFAIEGDITYSVFEILGLVVILLLIALFASTVLLIISTLAKNIKEASTMAMPIYIAAIISPMISMFSNTASTSKTLYFIPIYNTILGLKEILGLNFNLINFLIILGSSLVYIALFVYILVRLFKSERVLYSK